MESDAAVAVLDAAAEELPPQAERASESDMAAAIAAALRFVDFFKVVPPFDLIWLGANREAACGGMFGSPAVPVIPYKN